MAKRTINIADVLDADLAARVAEQGYPSPEAWLSAIIEHAIIEGMRALDDTLIRRAREKKALTKEEQTRVKTLLNLA